MDEARLFEVNEVGLVARRRFGKVSERSKRRLPSPVSGGLANFGVNGALPGFVGSTVKDNCGVAGGEQILIRLADSGGVTFKRRYRGVEALALEKLSQRNRGLAVAFVANYVDQLPPAPVSAEAICSGGGGGVSSFFRATWMAAFSASKSPVMRSAPDWA